MLAPTLVRAEDFPVPAELTRAEARKLTLKHSVLLDAEAYEIELERADARQARLRPNPTLTAVSQGLGSSGPELSPLDRQEVSVTVGFELETAGKRRKRVLVEETQIAVRQWEERELRRRLLFELDQSYFELALAQADLETVRMIRERFGRVVDLNRIRFQQGEISGAELRQTEAEYYRILEEAIAAEVRLENAQDSLLALMGSDDLDRSFRAADPLETSFSTPSREQLKETALRRRPDLLAERQRLTEAEAVRDLEGALAKPNVVPFGGYRRDFGADGLIVGIEMDLPLFQKNQGNIARAQLRVSQQERRIRLREIAVAKEVRLSLNRLEADRRLLSLLEGEHLPKARQSREIVETSYRLGEASLTELLDVVRRYGETVRRFFRTLHDFRVSVARLEFAVGEDLQP